MILKMKDYPAIFKDKRGTEEIIIQSNGSELFTTIRGIDMRGNDFDQLTVDKIDNEHFDYQMYRNGSGDITNFSLTIAIPLHLYDSQTNKAFIENVIANIEVGETTTIEGLDHELHSLLLTTSFGAFKVEKKLEWMEDALIALQDQLPEHVYLKTCLSCKFSNYHPVGNGMFGSLGCFRNFKKELQQVNDKYDLMDLWTDDKVQNESLFFVQETFDCEQHELLTDKDWCYKSWTKTM